MRKRLLLRVAFVGRGFKRKKSILTHPPLPNDLNSSLWPNMAFDASIYIIN